MTNQPHSGRSGCRGTLAASSASEGRDGITDVVMLAQRLCVVALLLSLAVLVVPVKGSDVLGSGESLNCGPASTAAIGLTRPELPDEPIMWPGSDLGIGRGAWCQVEARERAVPAGISAVGFAALPVTGRRSRTSE